MWNDGNGVKRGKIRIQYEASGRLVSQIGLGPREILPG